MSSEAWALVGVVLGVVLSAVTQVVVDRLGRRHERAMALRAERREAYVEMLAAATETMGPLAASRFGYQSLGWTKDADENALRIDVDQRREVLTAGGTALTRLGNAVARVNLLAPSDTAAAAGMIQAALMGFMLRDEDGMVERLATAQIEFADLAKRDLAMT